MGKKVGRNEGQTPYSDVYREWVIATYDGLPRGKKGSFLHDLGIATGTLASWREAERMYPPSWPGGTSWNMIQRLRAFRHPAPPRPGSSVARF